eukprot:PhF_6_TR28128/c0_g1_i1/m.41615
MCMSSAPPPSVIQIPLKFGNMVVLSRTVSTDNVNVYTSLDNCPPASTSQQALDVVTMAVANSSSISILVLSMNPADWALVLPLWPYSIVQNYQGYVCDFMSSKYMDSCGGVTFSPMCEPMTDSETNTSKCVVKHEVVPHALYLNTTVMVAACNPMLTDYWYAVKRSGIMMTDEWSRLYAWDLHTLFLLRSISGLYLDHPTRHSRDPNWFVLRFVDWAWTMFTLKRLNATATFKVGCMIMSSIAATDVVLSDLYYFKIESYNHYWSVMTPLNRLWFEAQLFSLARRVPSEYITTWSDWLLNSGNGSDPCAMSNLTSKMVGVLCSSFPVGYGCHSSYKGTCVSNAKNVGGTCQCTDTNVSCVYGVCWEDPQLLKDLEAMNTGRDCMGWPIGESDPWNTEGKSCPPGMQCVLGA